MSNWSDIGNTLRTTRESAGFSIHDIAHYTRIPVKALHELEEGDYSSFPSPAYARGFLAQYAQHLEVDASDWLDDFEVEETPLDLKNYDFLNDQEEELAPMPSNPARPYARAEKVISERVPSAALQPLAVFVATAMLLSAGVYGFIKLNDRLSTAAAEEPTTPRAVATTVTVDPPRNGGSNRSVSGSPAVPPSLAVNHPPIQETLPPAARNEEISQPLIIHTAPPRPSRAVIVEE